MESVLATCLFSGSVVLALEPLPPAAVDEWMRAFGGGHASLRAITRPDMMLALAASDRLGELARIFEDEPADAPVSREEVLKLVHQALNELSRLGHLDEAAKVDAALVAAAPRLRFDRETAAAAARLAAAGETDALLRMAETLLLFPYADRNFEVKGGGPHHYGSRWIEVPPVDNPTLSRSSLLLPALRDLGAIHPFRELAEVRVAAHPADFDSLEVLALATLLDTGDDPALWQRITDADGFFRGRDFVVLKNAIEFCYQLRIPAPHLCAMAERLYDESDHYGTTFQPHEFCLMLAALWKDLGEIEKTRRMLNAAADAAKVSSLSAASRLLEKHGGVLVHTMADERLAPELDRWIRLLSTPLDEGGDVYEMHPAALEACSWAIAGGLPRPLIERWFDFADAVAEVRFQRMTALERFDAGGLKTHLLLLLDAGLGERASDWLRRITRAIADSPQRDFDVDEMQAWIDAAMADREFFSIRSAGGGRVGSTRWRPGREYLGHSAQSPTTLADVFPPVLDDREEIDALENLVPDRWLLRDEGRPCLSMVGREVRDGMIRLGHRGGEAGGDRLELWSEDIALEGSDEFVFSGRIRALGRAGVTLEFLDAAGQRLRSEKITEHVGYDSPGERWFRVTLARDAGNRPAITLPAGTTKARILLTNSLSIESRWSDLTLVEATPAQR